MTLPDDPDVDLLDQLAENTNEGLEQGQPPVSQDPAWRPADALPDAT